VSRTGHLERGTRARWCSAAFVSAAACSGPVHHPVHRDELRLRPTEKSIIAECGRGSGNEIRLASGLDANAPSLVLQETQLHGLQPPQPTLAIWSDGHVLFEHVRSTDGQHRSFEMLEGSIPKAEVQLLIHDITAELVRVPRHADTRPTVYVSGGQLTTITVHDGDRWLSASFHGAYESDFLSAAVGAPAEQQVAPAGSAPLPDPLPPSLPFSRAYKRLLETRPDRGVPFVAYDFDVTFFVPVQYYVRMGPSEMMWPAELPSPPPAFDLEACDPRDGGGCPFMLDTTYRGAAERLHATLHASKVPTYVLVNGKRFFVSLDGLYRGQRSIEAISYCSEHLSKQDNL
jgi:hypothetical protein